MTESIVMIHGMWGGGWCWEDQAKFFGEKGYQCITPTLPFHDIEMKETPDPRLQSTSILEYVEYLKEEIQSLDELPILMGHSMGGLIAQILGSQGLARALVLLTPASPGGVHSFKISTIRGFWSCIIQDFWRIPWKKPMRQTFNGASYSLLHMLPAEEQKAVFDRFVYESGRAVSEIGFWFLDRNHATRVDETSVTCPVLVIAGDQDRMVPATVVQRVAAKYKDVSTYKEFPNHAHWIIGEPEWQEIAEYVSGWLDQALSPGNQAQNT